MGQALGRDQLRCLPVSTERRPPFAHLYLNSLSPPRRGSILASCGIHWTSSFSSVSAPKTTSGGASTTAVFLISPSVIFPRLLFALHVFLQAGELVVPEHVE